MKNMADIAGNGHFSDVHLSDKEKLKFKNSILSLSGALVCLAAGHIYGRIFPQQDIIQVIIYLVGICIIGIPMFITAIRGLVCKDMKYAMEILVTIAMIISTLSGQFLLAILIPVILTFVHFLEEKSIMGGRDAIEGLKTMQAEKAIILKDGKEILIDAKELKSGDTIIIKPGMYLPVDGEVVFGASSIDQKSLTGESIPKTVEIEDPVFAGTVNIDGNIKVKVTKEYADTSFQKIVKLLEDSGHIQMPDTKIVDKFIFYYIPLTLVTALLVWLFTQDITRAIAILVASCPCGHLLINSAPMIAVLADSAKRGILIKNSSFVEHLGETDFIIFDKTGTITNGILEAGSFHLDHASDFNELIMAASCAAHASLHPISKSIISLCERKDIDRDFEIKEHIGKGIEGKKGDDVIYLGSYSWMRSLGYQVSDKYENSGACDWVVKNGKILGCIVFKDTPRDNAAQVISQLKSMGVSRTCLLTGDHFQSAKKIQDAVGIDEMQCELLPEQKLDCVEKMMEGHTVTVIGDGINDALALSRAHVGIAMGAMGSDTAIQSADIALMNNNLSNIPYVIKLARRTKDIIYQNIILAFSVSIIMIFLAGAGIVTPIAGAFFHNIGAFLVLLNSSRVSQFGSAQT
ncbi:MAG: cation-translocating P-type ATPase [Treponema sp.]|jgi:Cd2+/Zn2+-exporting ATPase/Cu+-exporting ATPase|nr:cation-translocating P-type ATPase [Treponema sp.]